jgi:ankyrin repeat protein
MKCKDMYDFINQTKNMLPENIAVRKMSTHVFEFYDIDPPNLGCGNIKNHTCNNLHEAASNGDIDKIEMFLKKGSYINQKTPDDMLTPLMCASMENHVNAVKFLIESGARLDIKDRQGKTALCYAVEFDYFYVVELLINAGAKG